jgi:RND family efflux transporter MFP subunit
MSPKNPIATKLAKFGLPVLVLAAAIGGGVLLVVTQEEPVRDQPRERRVLVETEPVEGGVHQLNVTSAGEVIPARTVQVTPQVAGRVVWVNDKLVPGGVIEQGETLFRIDPRDYENAVEERRTELEQARAQLEQERGRVQVAEREWELFKDEVDESVEDPSLALRKPQLRSARVSVQAAQARLEQAKLALERTEVDAPFDAFVQTESLDLGQTVSTQSQVATLVGTDTFWVRTSVPVDKISYVNIPGVNAQTGSPATVEQDVGGRTIERVGRVAKLQGDLDPQGRMARLIIEVPNPFGLEQPEDAVGGDEVGGDEPDAGQGTQSDRDIPLLLSAFVDVKIAGPTAEDLVEVPREALHGGNQVYVYADDDTLDIRDVEVAWERTETVLVSKGVAPGERVVTSPIATAVEGMKLRRAEERAPEGEEQPAVGGGPSHD